MESSGLFDLSDVMLVVGILYCIGCLNLVPVEPTIIVKITNERERKQTG